MAEAKAPTVEVTALKFHTIHGEAHEAGDTYDVAEAEVANLVAQGMAKPTKDAPPPAAKPSHPVEPMTTDDLGVKPKAKK